MSAEAGTWAYITVVPVGRMVAAAKWLSGDPPLAAELSILDSSHRGVGVVASLVWRTTPRQLEPDVRSRVSQACCWRCRTDFSCR